jgi:hypothetical protein
MEDRHWHGNSTTTTASHIGGADRLYRYHNGAWMAVLATVYADT